MSQDLAAAPATTIAGPGGEGDSTASRWGRRGFRPLLLLAAVGLVDGIDKGILPGVITLVQDELGFSDTQVGLLPFAFTIASFLMAVPAGYLADRRPRTKIIAVVLTIWAALSALTAMVTNFFQFFVVRAALGMGETMDNPASSSLIADYYPARIRGRAYAFQRVAGTVGSALGLILAGIVAGILGWRAAFLLVGVPGSLLAFSIWRLEEPQRGEADIEEAIAAGVDPSDLAPPVDPTDEAFRMADLIEGLRAASSIPSLRALIVGTGVAAGALSGIGFWAAVYHERHSNLSGTRAAALTGGLILLGAIGGTIIGGRVADKARGRRPGAPLEYAAIGMTGGAIALLLSFLPVPVYAVRMPLQIIGVGAIVGALPATAAMTSEVTPPAVRGTAFSLIQFLSTLVGAFSPLFLGFVADTFPFTNASGEMVGNTGLAFALFMPLIFVGSVVLWRGARHVEGDRRAALEASREDGDDDDPDGGGGPLNGGDGGNGDGGSSGSRDSHLHSTTAVRADQETSRTIVLPKSAAEGSVETRRHETPARDGAERLSDRLAMSGLVGMVLGFIVIVLGWRGASLAPFEWEQIPYIVSGGILGAAIFVLGGSALVASRVLRVNNGRRREAEDLQRVVAGLRADLLG